MQNLLKLKIDYRLFSKYDKDYFINNKIVPIIEDTFSMKFAVCKESNLLDIKDKFTKIINFVEIEKNDIEFVLANFEQNSKLFSCVEKSLNSNASEDFMKDFLKELVIYSLEKRASDIHIEKFEDLTLFKFRVDGRLKIFFSCEDKFIKNISSYLKLISNLDITQVRLPLDGRFSIEIDEKKYDFRLSTMPTIQSESIVIRILDNKNIDKSLENLGFSEDILGSLKDFLKLTQGLILISGPTGSGKTTTLYSMINEINSEEKKIITIEDPVEYKLSNINQVPINSKIGLSFEIVLRNILRQDPDIIFIGEIRDKFSLDIALQASLTGHLVLASIHSNSAVETISRLIDLQADPFLLSSSLKMVLAQRLVLQYCKNCFAKGCNICNFTKFYDRSSLAEILKIDEEISSLIFKKSSKQELLNYLKTVNYKTLLDDGESKVQANITSIEEVLKVVNAL